MRTYRQRPEVYNMLKKADDLSGEMVTVRQRHLQAKVLHVNGEGFGPGGHLQHGLLQGRSHPVKAGSAFRHSVKTRSVLHST